MGWRAGLECEILGPVSVGCLSCHFVGGGRGRMHSTYRSRRGRHMVSGGSGSTLLHSFSGVHMPCMTSPRWQAGLT